MSEKILQGPRLDNPFIGKTLGEFFFENAPQYSTRKWQVDAGLNISESYENMIHRTTRLAMQLLAWEVTPADIVCTMSENILDCYIVAVGVFYVGAKLSAINPFCGSSTIESLLAKMKPKVIFLEVTRLEKMEMIVKRIELETRLVLYGSNNSVYECFVDAVQPKPDEDQFQPVKVSCKDVAAVVLTSGTTGSPKMVCHTHEAFIVMINRFNASGVDNSKVFYYAGLHWISTLGMLFCAFIVGGCRVFTRKIEREHIFGLIERHQPTSCFLSPTLASFLTAFKDSGKFNTTSLKSIGVGGMSITAEQVYELNATFPTVLVMVIYALTEMGSISFFNLNHDKGLITAKILSCGKIAFDITAKVVHLRDGELCGPNEYGVLYVKSPSLFAGYFGDEESYLDEEGFFRTEDIVYYDEEKCLYIVDRTSNMFYCRDSVVIPAVIENHLLQHAAVADVVVFGTPNAELGEEPTAYVVQKADCEATAEGLQSFLEGKISENENLSGGVFFCEQLMKNANGRVLRKEMREKHLAIVRRSS